MGCGHCGKEELKCLKCGMSFESKEKLMDHKKEKHM